MTGTVNPTVLNRATLGSARSARLTADREREILRAAYDLLAEVGYEGLRFDAVAAKARASKATLYRHWSSKAQLVADAFRSCKTATQSCPDTGSLRGDLVSFLDIMAESVRGEDGTVFAALVTAMHTDPEFAVQMRALAAAKRATAVTIYRRAIERGEIGDVSDPGLIDEIAPALMFMRRFARGEPMDDRFINHLVDDILMPLLQR